MAKLAVVKRPAERLGYREELTAILALNGDGAVRIPMNGRGRHSLACALREALVRRGKRFRYRMDGDAMIAWSVPIEGASK